MRAAIVLLPLAVAGGLFTYSSVSRTKPGRVDAAALAILDANDKAVRSAQNLSAHVEINIMGRLKRVADLQVARPNRVQFATQTYRRNGRSGAWESDFGKRLVVSDGAQLWSQEESYPAPRAVRSATAPDGSNIELYNLDVPGFFKPQETLRRQVAKAQADGSLIAVRDGGTKIFDGKPCRVVQVETMQHEPGIAPVDFMTRGMGIADIDRLKTHSYPERVEAYIGVDNFVRLERHRSAGTGGSSPAFSMDVATRDLHVNAAIPAATFTYKAPPGARIKVATR